MSNQEQPQKTPTVKFVIDRNPEIENLRTELENEKIKNSKNEETIKSMLKSEKEKFEDGIVDGHKKPTVGGDIPPLEQKRYEQTISLDGSYIPSDMIFGKTPTDVLEKIETLAKSQAENADEYKKILSKVAKKALTSDKSLSLTFKGDNRLFLRTPKKIGEFDSQEIKEIKEKYNEKLRQNRTNWSID